MWINWLLIGILALLIIMSIILIIFVFVDSGAFSISNIFGLQNSTIVTVTMYSPVDI
jgi:hypothetical protein